MISDEIKSKISERLGFSFDDLLAANAAEDQQDLELSKVEMFTDAELSELKKGVKRAGIEEEIKQYKRDHSLEFTGKTLDGLFAHGKGLGVKDGQKEPEQRYTELEGKYRAIQSEKDDLIGQIDSQKNKMFNFQAATKLQSSIDIETTIPKGDIWTIFSSTHEVTSDEDGRMIVKKHGSATPIQDDKTLSPLEATKVFKSFAENYKATSNIKPPKVKRTDGALTFETKSELDAHRETNEMSDSDYNKALIDSTNEHGNEFFN